LKLVTRSLTLATIAALSVQAFAEDQEDERVSIGGFAIEPWGHLAPSDTVVIHPKALVGISYNTNVFATQNNEKGDTFYSAMAGFDLRWRPTQEDHLTFSGEFVDESYVKQTGRDLSGGKGSLFYKHDAQVWDATGQADYARTNDPFINTGEEIKHDDMDVAIAGTRHWEYDNLGVGASFARRNYLENSLTFGKNDRDYNTYGANVRAGREVNDASEYYARLWIDQRNYDHNTLASGGPGFNNSTGYGGVVGVKSKIGTRSGVLAELGATYRVYSDDFQKNAAYNDKTVLAPAGNLLFRWNYEEGSWVGARAFSSIEESVESNAAWLYGAGVDARYRLLEKAALFGDASIFQLKNSGHAPPLASDEVRTTEEITAGAEYTLHRGLGVRLKNVYDNSHSKYFNSFQRDIIGLELGFVY
jgi:hypothetical protein